MLSGHFKLMQRTRKCPTHLKRDIDRHSWFTRAKDRSILKAQVRSVNFIQRVEGSHLRV